ncbi:MAG: hydroxymethylbilane synthase [Planctomycetia bacterium]|nr:hydroxymethylbilane synthase [Planctomycetia bacterium]
MAALRIRLGTRASALARWQADWVAGRLRQLGANVELAPIATQGDRDQRGPIAAIGGQGLFTKELQAAVLDGRTDLAVHSLKDLPTDSVAGLCLAAVPERGPTADVLVSRGGLALDKLPPGARVATGSIRRRAQLLFVRQDLAMADVRGNVDTRLRKLDEGQFDALVLAEAGLVRLGMQNRVTQVLPPSIMLPAVGQGALAIEAREDATEIRQLVQLLDDQNARAAVLAERALLAALRAGCLAPVGASARVEHGQLRLAAVVLSPDGRRKISAEGSGDISAPEGLGERVAAELLAKGAAELIASAKGA